jgi:hypothetical protein
VTLSRNFIGWAWIFILEGLFTVLAAIASFWIVEDFPETAKFLSETESLFHTALKSSYFHSAQLSYLDIEVWVIRQLQADMQFSAGGERMRWRYIVESIKDWKTWIASRFIFDSHS